MAARTAFEWWYGRDEPAPLSRALRAGPLAALLEGGDLRYATHGGVEVIRRLYVAVRDHNWDTIPAVLSDLEVEAGAERAVVRFNARHQRAPLDFQWRGEIVLADDGGLTYTMEGQAHAAFRYNRIGICVLHPDDACAGRPYRARTPEGEIDGRLPERIGVQRVEGGRIYALFPAYRRLEIDQADGVSVSLDFEGDLFEMEDQRNWTDASFKTYSTPLALPFPKDARPGQAIRQRVAVRVAGPTDVAPERRTTRHRLPWVAVRPAGSGEAVAVESEPVEVAIGPVSGRAVPPLGLAAPAHLGAPGAAELDLLRAVRPAHLRVDLHPADPAMDATLANAAALGAALGCPLEVALFLGAEHAADLARVRRALAAGPPVVRCLVFHAPDGTPAFRPVSTGPLVELARAALADLLPDVAFVGGTDRYFTDLNRQRPDPTAMDAIAYSLNPQVHAFDERSLAETLAVQAETVRSAAALGDGRPIVVSPVTLQPRYNPNATGPVSIEAGDRLPAAVDARQMSLFGAGWTLGSVKYLAEGGAASVTYYETTGWRGVLEQAGGSPLPALFRSEPGMVFPLYHVLADLADLKGSPWRACRSNAPLWVEALALQAPDRARVLLASLVPKRQVVELVGLTAGTLRLRRLNAETAEAAALAPGRFRAAWRTMPAPGARIGLDLAPFEVVCLDVMSP